jgi:HSP20 family protein
MANFFGKDIFYMMENNGKIGSLPGVNVIENKDEFRIEVAVPGLKKEHFNVNLDKNM